MSAVIAALLLNAGSASAQLLDTKLGLQVLYQGTETSLPTAIGFTVTATVSDAAIEFPDLSQTTQANDLQLSIVPVSIDAGGDFVEIRVLPIVTGEFSEGYFNGYVLSFGGAARDALAGARIDPAHTTIAVTDADLRIEGNELWIDVAGRSYGPDSAIRIGFGDGGKGL